MSQPMQPHEGSSGDGYGGSETEEIRCMYCEDTYSQLASLMSHIKRVHKEHYTDALSKSEKHKCLWCDTKFAKLSHLMTHIETNHPDQYNEAQNSKNLDRSKKEQILREGKKDERPESSGSSGQSSPGVESKNNNKEDPTTLTAVKPENIKRNTETVVLKPKKFKKPRLHALDDITQDERNPPPEQKMEDPTVDEIASEGADMSGRTHSVGESSVISPPVAQFATPKHVYQGPALMPEGVIDHSKLFSPLIATPGSVPYTKLREDPLHTRIERPEELLHRSRGRPSKLATIMGAQGSSMLDVPPVEVGRGSSGQYKCFWCDQTFKMRGRLMDHIDQQHKSSKEQQDKEASASLKQKLTHSDMTLPGAVNGWPQTTGPFLAPSWPHTLPIPGYFFPQLNGLDYMCGRSSAFPTSQQPSFPGPVPVSLVPNSSPMSNCKFFKLGASRTRLTSCRIRASDILRKQKHSCRFYYLKLRDCSKVFCQNPDLVPCCFNGNVQDDSPSLVTVSEPLVEVKDFFRQPFLPDPRLHGMPWLSPGAGRRSSVPSMLPLEVSKIKQEPSDDLANLAAFASSSRYGRRGSFPLDLRNPGKTPDLNMRRSREYPL